MPSEEVKAMKAELTREIRARQFRNKCSRTLHEIVETPGRGGISNWAITQLRLYFSKKVPAERKPDVHAIWDEDEGAAAFLERMVIEWEREREGKGEGARGKGGDRSADVGAVAVKGEAEGLGMGKQAEAGEEAEAGEGGVADDDYDYDDDEHGLVPANDM